MALRSVSKNSVIFDGLRLTTLSCFLCTSPNLILKRYSKALPISVSGASVPLRVTTLLDRNNPNKIGFVCKVERREWKFILPVLELNRIFNLHIEYADFRIYKSYRFINKQ